jgi:hypothetical protein
VEKWLMMTFVMEYCLLDLFVVLDLDSAPIKVVNSILTNFNLFEKQLR